MQTHEIKSILRSKFKSPEWALLFEVGDSTGARQKRWADAVAMNLWPSRGLELHGFEIKSRRGDWLKELKNPAKSAPIQNYCERWWIVAPEGIVKHDELPPTWGLYETRPTGTLIKAVDAPKLESVPMDRNFVAAMLRRSSEIDENEVNVTVNQAVQALRLKDEIRFQNEVERRTAHTKAIENKIARIESISGIRIDRWIDEEKLGRAIGLVMQSGVLDAHETVRATRNMAVAMLDRIEKSLNELERIQGK